MNDCKYKADVVSNTPEDFSSKIFKLVLKIKACSEGFLCEPGQFVSLPALVKTDVMPRPFSVVKVVDNEITLLIKNIGGNTNLYSKLKRFDEIFVFGPYGKPIKIKQDTNYILVGGGVGTASLPLLEKKLINKNVNTSILVGYKRGRGAFRGTPWFVKHLRDSHLDYIEDKAGKVTKLLEAKLLHNEGKSHVVTCGPNMMMKAVAQMCAQHGNSCEVILEAVMACGGMGACKCCSIPLLDGSMFYVCSQGPTIDSTLVDWDTFVPEDVSEELILLPSSDKSHVTSVDMKVNLISPNGKELRLSYPTMNASGCLSIESLEDGSFDISKLGALFTKGVTMEPREGNPFPRSCEVPSGMLNTVGISNVGIEAFIKDELPRWLAIGKKYGKKVIVNISGNSAKEYVELTKALVGTGIDGVEVNISCPNLERKIIGTDSGLSYGITKAVVEVAEDLFVIVKLTPNVTDIVEVAKAVMIGGADAVSLINTVQGMAIDVHNCQSRVSADYAGLSGPAIHPIAVRAVNQVYNAHLGMPIIAVGGVDGAESAAEFFIAGANAIACGTGGFNNPNIITVANAGVESIIREHGYNGVQQLIGSYIPR